MTRRRKQLHRKPHARRHGRLGHPDVACRYACTADGLPDTIEHAKQASHDALIDELGARRRSGIVATALADRP